MKAFLLRSEWSGFDRLMAMVSILFLLWGITPYIFPASQFIELHKVEVSDGYSDQPIPLTFSNTLYVPSDLAYYEVDIVNVESGLRECYARRGVPYDRNPKDLLGVPRESDKTLRWWSYSEDGECDRWDRAPGEYVVLTRHCWQRYWWARVSCNNWFPSNEFTIFPALYKDIE